MSRLIAADIGNSFSVCFDGRDYHKVRSVVANVPSLLNARRGEGLVTYHDKQYHCGSTAFKYEMYRMMATADKQIGSSYTDSLILLFNTIVQFAPLEDLTEIVIQVPDTFTSYHHDLIKLINNSHTWMVDGTEYTTKLKVKNVYQEGFGSWYMAKRSDALSVQDGYSIVIDLGGGTVITTLIDNETGEVMKTYTNRGRGVVALANLLVQDYDLILDNDGVIPAIEQIFAGFESKTLQLGTIGISFEPYIHRYVQEWWKSIWLNTVNTYRKQLTDRTITKVLITGGGATIVEPFIEAVKAKPGYSSLFDIAFNPLLDNVAGIYYAENDR